MEPVAQVPHKSHSSSLGSSSSAESVGGGKPQIPKLTLNASEAPNGSDIKITEGDPKQSVSSQVEGDGQPPKPKADPQCCCMIC